MDTGKKTALIITQALTELFQVCGGDPAAQLRSIRQLVYGTLGYVAHTSGMGYLRPHSADDAVGQILDILTEWVMARKSELN